MNTNTSMPLDDPRAFDLWLSGQPACADGRLFALGRSLRQVYEQCPETDWLWWLWWRSQPKSEDVRSVFIAVLTDLGLCTLNVRNCLGRWTTPMWDGATIMELLSYRPSGPSDMQWKVANEISWWSSPPNARCVYSLFSKIDMRKYVSLESLASNF